MDLQRGWGIVAGFRNSGIVLAVIAHYVPVDISRSLPCAQPVGVL